MARRFSIAAQRVGAIVLLLFALSVPPAVADNPIRIGVLSHRGAEATRIAWGPTAIYLGEQAPGHSFEVVPLDFAEVVPAVRYGEVDFLLVNPGIYVDLERRFHVSRIATLANRAGETALNQFGGVIFTRSDRSDLQRIEELRGHSFMGVDENSLGGFQMARGVMQQRGVDPYRDLKALHFGGTHDEVVLAVRDGLVDAGTVRTNILERMASEGWIRLDEFRVIEPRHHPEFFFAHSTPLYPEWPFSKLQHTPNDLAQRVAVALLSMPADHPAALAGEYAGWTVPLDYQPVDDLFRQLGLPPYDQPGRFTLGDAVVRYWYWVALGFLGLTLFLALALWALRLSRALRKANLQLIQRHELILNSVADGIYGVDLAGNSTFVNRAAEEITGWRAEELIGRNQHRLLHHTRPDGAPFPPEECPVYHTFRDSRPRFVEDDLFWRKDGRPVRVEYSTNPIRDERGATVGSVVVFRDIGPRRQAEEEARRHQQELTHVARLSTLGEMASGIAHELNQPLTAIAANAGACIRMIEAGEGSGERLVDVLDSIALQAGRAGEIIRQLRRMVRKEEPERIPIDLSRLVRGVALLCEPEARRAGVELRLELAEGTPPVRVQPIQIEQVVLNLARNAVDALAERAEGDRRLVIRTYRAGRHAMILEVEDNGPGFSPELRERLFTPFVTTKTSGMGLGLSISKGIVESHQGNLYLDDRPGPGALFRVVLPMQEDQGQG